MAPSTQLPTPLQPKETTIIIGSGIVGASLAFHLSTKCPDTSIFVLDSSVSNPRGSTSLAPGLVGQLNEITHLATVAKETIAQYVEIPGAFQNSGGLEIAKTQKGIETLKHRKRLADQAGLKAEILTSTEVVRLAPDFHAADEESVGLFFPSDGTVDPSKIGAYFQSQAKAHGVIFAEEKVVAMQPNNSGMNGFVVSTTTRTISAEKVIIAAGIWTPKVLVDLGFKVPIVPVAHPYAYGPTREVREIQQPFVRWPERHIYARDHGDRDGFGTYDHEPVVVQLAETALGDPLDSAILEKAVHVFERDEQRKSKVPYQAFNGVFAVTPDGMPLAGKLSDALYVAAAVWVTHAGGVSRLVADMVAGTETSEGDFALQKAFDPKRFDGGDQDVLRMKALSTYNDIYNQSESP